MSVSFLGTASLASAAVADTPEGSFLALNAAAMDKMMTGMAIKPTGDADRDFVAMMIPHHQGAIDMATAELQYGRDQKLIRIAQEIVVEQLQEIAAMRLAIGEPATPTWATNKSAEPPKASPTPPAAGASGADAQLVSRLNTAMDKMMAGMGVKPTGDVDRDFVATMIPHHQGAIEMAQAELLSGANPQLKTIAQEIVTDQVQEIALMRLALGEAVTIASPTSPSSSAMPSALEHGAHTGSMQMEMSPAMSMTPPSAH